MSPSRFIVYALRKRHTADQTPLAPTQLWSVINALSVVNGPHDLTF